MLYQNRALEDTRVADHPRTLTAGQSRPSVGGLAGRLNRFVAGADTLLNRKRLTHYPLLLLVVSLAISALGVVFGNLPYDAFGKPVAVDLSAYVTGARIVLDGDVHELYSLSHQRTIQQSILGNSHPDFLDIYIAPPFVAYAYAPFAVLPYSIAALIWTLLSLGLLALSVRLLWPLVSNLHGFGFRRVLFIVLASAPAFELLGGGQNSAISLFLMCAGLRLLAGRRNRSAGLVLGIGIFKPQLFILMPVLLLIERRWAAVTAWVTIAGALTGLSVWIVGINGARGYVSLLTSTTYEEHLLGELGWKMATVGSLLRSFVPGSMASGTFMTVMNIGVLVIGGMLLWKIRQHIHDNVRDINALTLSFATGVLIATTFAPHAFIYDSVLLVLPLMIFLNAFRQSAPLRVSVAAAYLIAWTTPLRVVAFADVGWPASVLMSPWVVVPILACLLIVYRNLENPHMRDERFSPPKSRAPSLDSATRPEYLPGSR